MRLPCCMLLVAALAASAGASVDFWFTSSSDGYGLADPSKAFLATGTNHTDYRDGWALANGAVPPPNMSTVCLSCDDPEFVYMWARFNDEPDDVMINGMAIGIDGHPAGQGNIAWSKGDSSADFVTPPHTGYLRWDGDPDVFYFNPAGLIAVTADGVRNSPVDSQINMYIGGDSRTFLLGAIKAGACPGEWSFTFGQIPVNYGPIPPAPNPEVNALNTVYRGGGPPEPASLMLLALTAALVRRRH